MSDFGSGSQGPEGGSVPAPVKGLVVYGTSRGTTETIGEAIAEGMNEAGADASALKTDLVKMVPQRIQSAEILGIGSPVYFLREPRFVADFVSGLPSLEGKRAFIFCTTGMDRVGETLERLHALVSGRGATVVGAAKFRTAMSYLPYRRRGLGNPADLPDESELQAARKFGAEMVNAGELPSIQVDSISRSTRWKARLLASRTFRKIFFPGIELKRPLCTGYGSCISRCAFIGLDREKEEEIPNFTAGCIQCLECIESCPKAALVSSSRIKEWISTLSYRLRIH
jgi:flavodoxin